MILATKVGRPSSVNIGPENAQAFPAFSSLVPCPFALRRLILTLK
ncbi:hypothetical protein SAMN05192566_2711, partial [Methylophilus rhizosphaerae]